MAKIFLDKVITEDFANDIVAQIEKESSQIDLHIDSPGGSVYKGLYIFNALQRKKNIVTTYVDGLAYSAASWIALAAPRGKRFMSRAAQFGVHQALNPEGGNKEELKAKIEVLEDVDKMQTEIYTLATGIPEGRIRDIMKKGKPLSIEEAKEFGFQEYNQDKIAAYFNIDNMDLKKLAAVLMGNEDTPKDVKEEVKKETEEALKKAETAKEQIQADLVTAQVFGEHKANADLFAKAVLEYIDSQPTKDEIEKWIEAKAEEKLLAFIKLVRTEEKIPKASDINLEKQPIIQDQAKAKFRERIMDLENSFKK